MKDYFKLLGYLLAISAIIITLTFLFGGADLLKKATIDRASINIERKNFEQSKSRLHGLADDLARYKFELTTEEDPIVRKALVEMIIDRTSSLDVDKLEDYSLRKFAIDVKNGKYNK